MGLLQTGQIPLEWTMNVTGSFELQWQQCKFYPPQVFKILPEKLSMNIPEITPRNIPPKILTKEINNIERIVRNAIDIIMRAAAAIGHVVMAE